MNDHFEVLTNVIFTHSYFPDAKFNGLSIKAKDSCLHMMANQGLLFKANRGGFQVLFNTYFAGRERTREDVLKTPFSLLFHLQLMIPAFYNYTEIAPYDVAQSVFYFSNISPDPEVTLSPGTLHHEQHVSNKDVYPVDRFEQGSFSKPFGLLNLWINKGTEKDYAVSFAAKATFWRYSFVSDFYRELYGPAVIDPGDHDTFEGPDELMLPDGRMALCFTSKNKITLSEPFSVPFQLVENYKSETENQKIVIKALPVPDIHTISKVGSTSKDQTKSDFSEIFIY